MTKAIAVTLFALLAIATVPACSELGLGSGGGGAGGGGQLGEAPARTPVIPSGTPP
jgi:hypothetical protein